MSLRDLVSAHAKTLCDAHECPHCGAKEHVTVERTVNAGLTITRCHCRVCGYSWHPQIADAERPA